ncbi:hypothetical protein EVAR_47899_1 [Eumeta japonica]|uniref:Uncharacterized protein n=1 Tax=Eumeta variegata TaxID=151549 RepID=A0A4C1Y9D6_EUMVA|nr:hypothetical protein EVAR_47899_1 [Eumeta japonica]
MTGGKGVICPGGKGVICPSRNVYSDFWSLGQPPTKRAEWPPRRPRAATTLLVTFVIDAMATSWAGRVLRGMDR